MNCILKENRDFAAQLKDSKAMLCQLQDDHQRKQESLKCMKKSLEELKCSPSLPIDVEQAWLEINDRDQMLQQVVDERNKLKEQLCQMIGISEVLRKLKARADEADCLEQEIDRLNRELQRCGRGAAGDDRSQTRPKSSCKQCDKYAGEVERAVSALEEEICKNTVTEGERNFLRERVRAMEVTEAELICYKVGIQFIFSNNHDIGWFFCCFQMRYAQCETELKNAMELLVRNETNSQDCSELTKQLEVLGEKLRQSELRSSDLMVSLTFYFIATCLTVFYCFLETVGQT